MPRPSHRVDLLFVPTSLTLVPDAAAFDALKQAWTTEGRIGAGADPDRIVLGGFRRLWLDLPGRLTLYANQQGGYYVRCPVDGGNIVPAFSAAVQGWRGGGGFSLTCTSCGALHSLDAVTLAPPGAFAQGAVVLSNVGGLTLAEGVAARLSAVLGGSHREVVRRVV
ncbi:MAG: hypothetical protein ACI8RZ_000462 [Myxococcota bacterium]|jgi:hypothetical protein